MPSTTSSILLIVLKLTSGYALLGAITYAFFSASILKSMG